ncbi:unnamed protein product [Protopolystoma xenopodis]|uniref:Uncharacterized protein n=1 Tax=Protopolystoma xenopodis TaxID=117903 RepID=A0A3S5AKB8_9PLAT|nr:unnamed protein product [Protopolystoma xenopodis]
MIFNEVYLLDAPESSATLFACVHGDARATDPKHSQWAGIIELIVSARSYSLLLTTSLAQLVTLLLPLLLTMITVGLLILLLAKEQSKQAIAAANGYLRPHNL